MYTKQRWKLDKCYWILEKCTATSLVSLSSTRFNVIVTRNLLESALISMKLKSLMYKNVSYASCATSIVANNSHSLCRIKNNVIRTDRMFIIRNNYPLLSTRADDFFSRIRSCDHCMRYLFLFFLSALFHDITFRMLYQSGVQYGEGWTAVSRKRYSGQVVSRYCGCRGQQIACFRASLHHSVTLLTLAGNPSAYLV